MDSDLIVRHECLVLIACTLLAVVLRLWNAETAFVHDDEKHYARDAAWAYTSLPAADVVAFLRNHPRDHVFIDTERREFERWGEEGRYPHLGHPAFYAIVLGILTAATPPESLDGAAHQGRRLNAVADSAVVPLLPPLLAALGFTSAVGLVAAFLYAVYPPAVAYGSLAYADPFLAPLFLASLVLLLRSPSTPRNAILAGVATGLLIATKQTGLVALGVLPVLVMALAPDRIRMLLLWGLATSAVLVLLVNPAAYLDCVLHPLDPYARLRPNPLRTLADNLWFLTRPYDWYWLGYSKHGRPLAAAIAPLHHLLTPAILWLFALGLVWLAALRKWAVALAIYLPVVAVLPLLPPSDGAWRVHMVAPLIVAGATVTLTQGRLAARAFALLVACALGLYPLLPATAARTSLADLLRADTRLGARQPHGLYDPLRRPLVLYVDPTIEIHRVLWLRPGSYELDLAASTWTTATLDGDVLVSGMAGSVPFEVDRRLHRFELKFMEAGTLESFSIKPR